MTAPGTTTTPATSASASPYSTTRRHVELRHEQIIEVFSREFLEEFAGQGIESAAPIFIVGLPRSGSTLIEQILASHSQVEGTAELPTLVRIAFSIGRYRRDRRVSASGSRPARAGFPGLRAAVHRRSAAFRSTGQAVLHRQAAEQLLARRPHPPDPAEREGHQCPTPSASTAASAATSSCSARDSTSPMTWTELAAYYRQYHETMQSLAPRPARQGARRALRGNGHRPRDAGAAHPRALRAAVRGGLPAIPREHARGEDGELRAGPAADLHATRSVTGAATRSTSGPGRRSSADIVEELPETVRNAGL